jgi:hypothetical protein
MASLTPSMSCIVGLVPATGADAFFPSLPRNGKGAIYTSFVWFMNLPLVVAPTGFEGFRGCQILPLAAVPGCAPITPEPAKRLFFPRNFPKLRSWRRNLT